MYYLIDDFIMTLSILNTIKDSLNSTLADVLTQLAQPGLSVYITLILFAIGIISALFGFLGGFFKDYFITKQKAQSTAELETLRAEINRDHAIFTASVESLSAGRQISIERRLTAIEVMWSAMKKQRALVSNALVFYDVLLPNEYDMPKSQEIVKDLIKNKDKIKSEIYPLQEDVERHRPFLGELLWNLFLAYNIFLLRILILISENRPYTRMDGKTLPWFKDPFIEALLKPIISEEKSIRKISRGAQEIHPYMASWVVSILEQEILLEVDRIISGKAMSEATLFQIDQISSAIATIRSTSSRINANNLPEIEKA